MASLAYDNGYEPLSYNDALEIARRYEIGSHTITHRHLTKISFVEARHEILGSKLMLQRLYQKEITKFCPPRGYTTQVLSDFTMQWYESQRLTKGSNLVHIHPDSGANHNFPWREYYNAVAKNYDEIELWGHSHEFDRFNLWDELEEFLRENTHS
jgi:peptidoglycan/xylan/chitin deacetylase (PgdA/CDA1 family)